MSDHRLGREEEEVAGAVGGGGDEAGALAIADGSIAGAARTRHTRRARRAC